jgi:ankyrin repeat protein
MSARGFKPTVPTIQQKNQKLLITPRSRQIIPLKKNADFKDNVKFYTAVQEANFELVQQLLEANEESEIKLQERLYDVNFHYSVDSRQTPLHVASKANNATIMELLITYGANVNAIDSMHRTPLHVATHAGAHEAVVILLSHGSKPNVRDHYGNSPFHLCIKNRNFDIAQDLILFGADPSFKRQDGASSLHEVMQRGDLEALNFFLKLHSEGTHILFNARDEQGESPIFKAVSNTKREVLQQLIKHHEDVKLNVSVENAKGQNLFHIAATLGKASMIGFLVDLLVPAVGVQTVQRMLNCADKTKGFSPLLAAVHAVNVKVCFCHSTSVMPNNAYTVCTGFLKDIF